MSRVFLSIVSFSVAVVCFAATSFAETVETPFEFHKMEVENRQMQPPFAPARSNVAFENGPAAPEGLLDAAAGTVDLGGRSMGVVLGRSGEEATSPDVVYLDANRDGSFSDDERFALKATSARARNGVTYYRGNNLDVVIKDGDRALPYVFAYMKTGDRLNAQMIAIWYGEATVNVGEKDYLVDLYDGDQDGKFSGEKDRWTIRAADEKVARPPSELSLSTWNEKRFLDGQLFSASIADGKVTVGYAAAEGPDPASLASQRARVEESWKERFDKERETFIKGREIDTTRPEAETPIHWNYVTFEKAQAMAKETGKPLFLDVMAFWCIWCYRMDYYTYPDKEVADLLNQEFVPVKIIQEQDRAGDYDKVMKSLGARGIPAMGIWDPDGSLVKYISGWSKPSDFVKTLNGALETLKAPK